MYWLVRQTRWDGRRFANENLLIKKLFWTVKSVPLLRSLSSCSKAYRVAPACSFLLYDFPFHSPEIPFQFFWVLIFRLKFSMIEKIDMKFLIQRLFQKQWMLNFEIVTSMDCGNSGFIFLLCWICIFKAGHPLEAGKRPPLSMVPFHEYISNFFNISLYMSALKKNIVKLLWRCTIIVASMTHQKS